MKVKTGYAPMSAVTFMRRAAMVPSSCTAASRSATWARPWVVASMCSTRVSVHLSARRWARASAARVTSSG